MHIVVKLEEKLRAKVRDDVLQHVLKSLTSSGSDPSPLAAAMMVEMVKLDLVLLKGVATTLEMLLKDKHSRRAAIAVLGKLSEQHPANEAVNRATSHLQTLVLQVADPTYDYDVITICRNFGWKCGSKASLVHLKTITASPHQRILSSAYFPGRDELATGGSEGNVAIWGSPSFGDVPAAQFTLTGPGNIWYSPVGMDASPKGSALAVACVASRTLAPVIKLFLCSESGVWSLGDTVNRTPNTIMTAIKAVSTRIGGLCVAESTEQEGELVHDVVLFGGNSATSETRKLARAHSDYITVVTSSAENENWLLTGSRDTLVKVWDTRNGPGTSPAHSLQHHTDTITSIAAVRDTLLTASLDNMLCLWDTRKLKSPVTERPSPSPILRVACATGASVVVATTQSLSLLSLHPFHAHDVVPNVCYTEVRPNHDGSVIFATGDSIDLYAIQPLPGA